MTQKISIAIQLLQAEIELEKHTLQLAELKGKGHVKAEEYTQRRINELAAFIVSNK